MPTGVTTTITTFAGDFVVNHDEQANGFTVTGTVSAGAAGDHIVVNLFNASNVLIGTATAAIDPNNTWTATFSSNANLTDGSGYFAVAAAFNSGNTQDGSSSIASFTVDTTPPTVTIDTIAGNDVLDAQEAQSGLTISGSASGVEDGQSVTVHLGTNVYSTTVSNHAWTLSIVPGAIPADGPYTATANVSDRAGNPAAQATHPLTIDTTPPAAPTIDLNTASDSGASTTDNLTNDATPSLSGTTDVGTSVAVFDGANKIGDATVDGSGHWTFTSAILGDGPHTLSAVATDAGGNTTPSGALVVTIDTTADSGAPAGVSIGDANINAGEAVSVPFTVTNLDVDATGIVTFTDHLGATTTVPVSSNGSYFVDLSGLVDGVITATLAIADPAGNTANGTTGTATLAKGFYPASYHLAVDSGHWEVTDGTHTEILTGQTHVAIGTATYLLVDQFGANGGYQSVQAAVNANVNAGGGTIMIAPGTYNGTIDFPGATYSAFTIESLNAGLDPDHWVAANDVTLNRISSNGTSLAIDGVKIDATVHNGVGGASYWNSILFEGTTADILSVKNSILTVDATSHGAPVDQAFGFNIATGTGDITIDHVQVTPFTNVDPANSQYGAWINGHDDTTRHVTVTNSSFDVGNYPKSYSLAFDGVQGGSFLTVTGNTFGDVHQAAGAVRAFDFSNALSGQVDYSGIHNNTFSNAPGLNGLMTNETNYAGGDSPGVTVVFGGNTYAGNVTLSSVVDASEDSSGQALNGTTGDDIITGSAFADTISALGGNDLITGGGGNDIITGGANTDTAHYAGTLSAANFSYDSVQSQWVVNATADGVAGGEGTDHLSGVGNVTDGAGHHFVLVSPDSDYTTFQDAAAAANGGTILTASSGGSTQEDYTFTLGDSPATLAGGPGDDTLTVTYTGVGPTNITESPDHQHILIDFDGNGTTDLTVSGVEDLVIDATNVHISGDLSNTGLAVNTITYNGTPNADTFDASGLTSTEDVVANGFGGNDLLTGSGGNDTFNGGAGSDTLSGLGGIDTATGYGANATISFTGGHWTVTDGTDVDTLSGIEKVVIGAHTYLLVDHAAPNVGGFSSIEAAIGAASDGDTIMVASGHYTLPGGDSGKELTFLGANAGISANDANGHLNSARVAETIIDGTGSNFRFESNGGTFDGFTLDQQWFDNYTADSNIALLDNVITNPGADLLYVLGGANTVTMVDNRVTGLTGSGADAVFVAGDWNGTTGTSVNISGNVFTNSPGAGGFNLSSVTGTIANNTIDGLSYYGFLLANDTHVDVTGNTFENIVNPDPTVATWGAGIRTYTPGPNFGLNLDGNTFIDNAVGLGIRAGSDIDPSHITITNNTFSGNTNAIVNQGISTTDVTLAGSNHVNTVLVSGATDAQLFAIEDNIVDAVDNATYGSVVLKPGFVYVTPNSFFAPGTTTADLQRAIDAAHPDDTIIVEAGTYVGHININKPLTILGANANIDGNGTRGLESIITGGVEITAAGVTINGVEISGSYNFGGLDLPTGLYFSTSAADATVENSVLLGDGSESRPASSSTVTGLDFTHNLVKNWGEGFYITEGSTGSITLNTFITDGSGVVTESNGVDISHNSFTGSTGPDVVPIAYVDEAIASFVHDNTYSPTLARPISVYLVGPDGQTVTGSDTPTTYHLEYHASGSAHVTGGAGSDTVSFSDMTAAGVVMDLGAGTAQAAPTGTENFDHLNLGSIDGQGGSGANTWKVLSAGMDQGIVDLGGVKRFFT